MTVDYIVVGSGLAGILFCETLRSKGKTFVVVDNNSQQSSTVAGGLYNPVILKRFTEVWMAKEQLALALPKYQNLEQLLDVKLIKSLPIYRVFASVEEQNNWFTAIDKPNLSDFMSTKIIENKNSFINADYGFGEVLSSGRVYTSILVKAYKKWLDEQGLFIGESFDYSELNSKSVPLL